MEEWREPATRELRASFTLSIPCHSCLLSCVLALDNSDNPPDILSSHSCGLSPGFMGRLLVQLAMNLTTFESGVSSLPPVWVKCHLLREYETKYINEENNTLKRKGTSMYNRSGERRQLKSQTRTLKTSHETCILKKMENGCNLMYFQPKTVFQFPNMRYQT